MATLWNSLAAFKCFWKWTVPYRAVPLHYVPRHVHGSLCEFSSAFVESVHLRLIPLCTIRTRLLGAHYWWGVVQVCDQVPIEVQHSSLWHALDHTGKWSARGMLPDCHWFGTGVVSFGCVQAPLWHGTAGGTQSLKRAPQIYYNNIRLQCAHSACT